MLRIEDLHVTIGEREVLSGINLHIAENETFILFGPNGSGKTTLLMTLMGFGNYEITKGRILFRGTDITYAPIYERARLGIGMSFQRPPTIHGLTTRQLVTMCARETPVDVEDLAKDVHMDTFLERDINAGFSGGEIKRSELLQLMAQKPYLLLFDEPESGVDLENMVLAGFFHDGPHGHRILGDCFGRGQGGVNAVVVDEGVGSTFVIVDHGRSPCPAPWRSGRI